MRGVWSVVQVGLLLCWASLVVPNCQQHNTCSDCIRATTCAWCSKENFTKIPRCMKTSDENDAFNGECDDFINEPNFYMEVLENEPLSEDDTEGQFSNLIQLKPQRVLLETGVGETREIKVTYKHLKNYPVDLYYLMDASKSMSDDKATLGNLSTTLVESMRSITVNLKVGFGAFVDKAILPYISTIPWDPNERGNENCDPPFSYKNVQPLTHDAGSLERSVNITKLAANVDSPEGALDALMQTIVCEEQIAWREQSIRLVVVTTDAGFHIAGDGKLGGITTPNDKVCHLNADGMYTHYAILDYPSVSQIREMVEQKNMQLIFAVTESQAPLYRHLQKLLPRTYSSTLADDSSNIIDILQETLLAITSEVTLKAEVANVPEDVSVEIYSTCTDGVMKKRSSCHGLEAGQELEFTVKVTVIRCPKDDTKWNTPITVSPDGRNHSLVIDLSMQCRCKCEGPGDQGYIANADKCSKHGDDMCGVCRCHSGYIGENCECKADEGESSIDESSCKQSNTSSVCSGRGDCICGQCVCKEVQKPKEISGRFCECTNFEGCLGANSLMCSDNGECECNECVCQAGWSGEFCECHSGSDDNCRKPGTEEICSGNGNCECNQCKCTQPYFGRFCEDCPTCSGKCDDLKPCVQCQVFMVGDLSPEECLTNCTLFNSTVVTSIDNVTGNLCSFFDDENCRFYVRYEIPNGQPIRVWVQEDVECPVTANILYIMSGVIAGVVVIGLITLISWKVLTSIHDRREFAKFVLDQNEQKWTAEQNPLYKPATTTVKNPMFEVQND